MIYTLRVNSRICPMVTDKNPSFSWKMRSDRQGASQCAYRIEVSENEDFNTLVWDTERVESDKSVNIMYSGKSLKKCTRYFWRVSVWDENGEVHAGGTQWFETGLLCDDESAWNGAKWIGSDIAGSNTDAWDEYCVSAVFKAEKTGIVIGARDKDNYILIEVDILNKQLIIKEYCDNAWEHGIPNVKALGSECGYEIPCVCEYNNICIKVSKKAVYIEINGETVVDEDNIIPTAHVHRPRKSYMMNMGIKQGECRGEYKNIKIEHNGTVYQNDSFNDDGGVLSALGCVKDGLLIVENEFNLINAVGSVNLKKDFNIKGDIKKARLYCSARGFYDVYVNGEKINESFYNPGFTDYRKRITYQTYDVTEFIRDTKNVIGAVVTNGYYSGYVGYSSLPMVYGNQNTFIAQLIIDYADGTKDILVTDETWNFTNKSAIIYADYLQGETYDARLEIDWNKKDNRWKKCGVYSSPDTPKPTNGVLENVKFSLAAQEEEGAKVEITLTPVEQWEMPKGHFVYDMGQNLVGTVRISFNGKRGKSVKLRYGEMCKKNGEVYIANLRNAANTDTYTLKGTQNEVFVPSMTSHGFRYIEITGNGCTLEKEEAKKLIAGVEALVIANTNEKTGYFECSDEDINRLQSNIEWGQRGNSLLVYTDCPQRNERMGWTGDAQVFAATAAYNMNVRVFMDKWLNDLREAQLMYNRNGAVPDTAPLGGDNRPMGGCGGWGDAAAIVPWEMYRAYGDIKILEENYDMIKSWVEYQSRHDRQNYGERTVDGELVINQSDLSSEPFIQIQQSRGDHLSFDESTPFILSATAYAARAAQIAADTASILGKKDDEKKFRKRFYDIKRAFNEAWVKEDGSISYWGEQSKSHEDENGNIINKTVYSNAEGSKALPSQSAYALAIDFGLIPEEKLIRAAECLKQAIEVRGNKISVGFLGISHLAPALTKVGMSDVAFKLLEQRENPGWLYSVLNGATTIWERWNSYVAESDTFGNVAMNSFNHYSYGAIGEWMFNTILGINPDIKNPGYKHIILTPTVGGTLEFAKGHFDSPYGRIKSAWKKEADKIVYDITIPSNTTADLYLQKDREKEHHKLESGSYKFEVKY